MELVINLLLHAMVVQSARSGIDKKNGRPWANLKVAGMLGDSFQQISIRLPPDIDIERFKAGDWWVLPLAAPQADAQRNVYYRLRTDAEGMQCLRKVTADWTPNITGEAA